MATQLSFDLRAKPALGRADFFVSASNAVAVAALESPETWVGGKLALIGAAGSGKTHLAHVWATEQNAKVVTAQTLRDGDITDLAAGPVALEETETIAGNRAQETLVFHLHNLLHANSQSLLITGRHDPAHWPLCLPDLKSRLQSAVVAPLEAPDDALLMQVMVKLFADRGIEITAAVLPYLVSRMERSFVAVQNLVHALDHEALARGKPIGRRLAGEVLDKFDQSGA